MSEEFIPKDQITDGYSLSLKNAKKLLKIAHDLFDRSEYAVCIFLAVIAIEELGKGIMLMQKRGEGVTRNEWYNDFRNHLDKAIAAVNHIREFVPDDDTRQEKLAKLDELEEYLRNHEITKLDSLYLNWDTEKSDWIYYDEKIEPERRHEANEVLINADWLITGYLIDGKFITERSKVIIEMVKVGLAYGHCKDCDLRIGDLNAILQHRKEFTDHTIDFRED